ncbi:MAG: hypothetical protein HYV32_05405 [Candidatus Kerfeldbacteria bacterium]|nr:hypothetical protein [Candidatus Kerfeldbacteria bacterium]
MKKKSISTKSTKHDRSNSLMGPVSMLFFAFMIVALIALRLYNHFAPEEKKQIATNQPATLEEFLNSVIPQNVNLDQLSQASLRTEAMMNKEIEFITRDSQTIHAKISKPEGVGPFATMILMHGGQSSQRSTDRMAEVLGEPLMQSTGMMTVTVDWRESTFGQEDLTDLLSTIDWVRGLQETASQPIILFGIEHGAYISLLATQEDVSIDGVIDAYGYINPAEEYRYLLTTDATSADNFLQQSGCHTAANQDACLHELSLQDVLHIDIPVLILHSEADTFVPIAQSEMLAAMMDAELLTFDRITDPVVGNGFLTTPSLAGFDAALEQINAWVAERQASIEFNVNQ